jgi:FkbH-like protein
MNLGLDYFGLVKEGAKALRNPEAPTTLRVALLGDCATQQFVPLLAALFRRRGVAVKVFEGGFDAIELDVYNAGSALYAFNPEVIVLLNSVQSLRDKFYERTGDAADFYERTAQRIGRIWDAIRANTPALVIQSNYVAPAERFFGNYDLKMPAAFPSIVATLNHRIAEESRSRSHVLLNDVEALASWVGRQAWFDERMWSIAKQFCALDHLPAVVQNIVEIVLAARGQVVKCVVLDLDNTLWGGVVGDDGAMGIQISAHGDGEPFYRFQCYLRELKNRGILLAVCSKNEHANAVAPFEQNPEMVLKMRDIAAFVANWENKADNIGRIRETLNIGLDSMVFLDDNPFERNLVRTLLPDVIVPEMPEDPSDYVKAVSALNLFETASYSAEDALRTELYAVAAERRLAESSAQNFEEYLESLDMRIEVGRFTEPQISRIAQLLQRSNQFNLTTHRYNQAQCEAMMADTEHYIPICATLRDRFGDHGLISIVVTQPRPERGVLEITDWLMSCRVLSRGVEEYLMNRVVTDARRLGLTRIRGQYIPTPKNGMVRDFFARFGFEKIRVGEGGAIDWELDPAAYTYRQVFIQPESDEQEVALHVQA